MREKYNNIASQVQLSTIVLTHVRFGMTSKKCRNYGICEVRNIRKAEIVGRGKKTSICNISLTRERKVKFSFDMSTMTNEGQFKYFGRGYFRMGEKYTLPEDISNRLGIQDFSIKSGSYPIVEEGIIKSVLFDFN